MDQKSRATFCGFELEVYRDATATQDSNLRGWRAKITAPNGTPVDYVSGPWFSALEAESYAEKIAKTEIEKLGEPVPTESPNWQY